jgi:hypothetical protein
VGNAHRPCITEEKELKLADSIEQSLY